MTALAPEPDRFPSFPPSIGHPRTGKVWAAAGARGVVLIGLQKTDVSPAAVTAYDIDEFRALVIRLQDVLDECDRMKHLNRHPAWDSHKEEA